MELIQTTEYLDDVPTWGLSTSPPHYGDPFYRGKDRGRQDWFQERPVDRINGELGRGFSHGNGIEVQHVQEGRTQQDRQEEDWSLPAYVERRENDT